MAIQLTPQAHHEASALVRAAKHSVYHDAVAEEVTELESALRNGAEPSTAAMQRVRDAIEIDLPASTTYESEVNYWGRFTRFAEDPNSQWSQPAKYRNQHFAWAAPDIRTLDPHEASDTNSQTVTMQLFEGLVSPLPGMMIEEPGTIPTLWAHGVAEHIDISPRYDRYVFTLRKDATWSNGDPVTAHDFVASFERALDPNNPRDASRMLLPLIRNAKQYMKGTVKDFADVGVYAQDDHTLVITPPRPDPDLLNSLALTAATFPVHRATVAKHGVQWTRPENIVSNGPFQLTKRDMSEIQLTQNPHYWGKERMSIASATQYITSNNSAAADWFQLGKIDWSVKIPFLQLEIMQNKLPEAAIRHEPPICSYRYEFNVNSPKLSDVRVRKALAMAVDRMYLAKKVLAGAAVASTSLVPTMFAKAMGYRSPRAGLGFDFTKAQELLADAGYTASNPLQITLDYNTDDFNRMAAENVQRQLQRNLNGAVNITLNNMEFRSLLDKIYANDFEMARRGTCADRRSVDEFLRVYESGNRYNVTGYSNPAFDQLLDSARTAVTTKDRHLAWAKAEVMLYRDWPFLPIGSYGYVGLQNPKLRGFEPNSNIVNALRFAHKEE